MKAIHELEPKRDEQRYTKQHVGPCTGDRHIAHILRNVDADIAQAAEERDQDDCAAHPGGSFLHFLVQEPAMRRGSRCRCQIGHRRTPEID